MSRKVLLIVIDALASRVVEPALEAGRLPMLAQLAKVGVLRLQSTAIFPSITPAATASIATGVYPSEHTIAGAYWYDEAHKRLAYYGDDIWTLINRGFADFVHDYLIKLNFQRLQSETLFEIVEQSDRTAAVLNYMWFRGLTEHEVNTPLLIKLLPGVTLAPRIRGPQITAIGDFVRSDHPETGAPITANGGVGRRFGFHDETTGEFLLSLADAGDLPDFTLAYFPNNDFDSHRVGPAAAVSTLEQIDVVLGTFVDRCGGLRHLLDETAIIITGDHSQSDLTSDAARRGIELQEVLGQFQLVPGGSNWRETDDIMVCPNMRATQFYLTESAEPSRRRQIHTQVVDALLADSRVDQAMWCEATGDQPGNHEFHVVTSDRGRLKFTRSSSQDGQAQDVYGNHWNWQGSLQTVDATVDSDNRLHYGDYPNALERIAGCFSDVSGDLWVTARPGFEFRLPATDIHGGGSHGSLHIDDSTSPLIVAGLPDGVDVPEFPRAVDIAPLALRILGIR